MKQVIVAVGLILSLNSFAETAQPAGVGVPAGVAVGGIAIPTQGARYYGTINTSPYPYQHLNGYYNVSSALIVKGQVGAGTINFTSFSGSQEVYSLNCTRAFDRDGTKTCIEVSNNQLKYITTHNPRTGRVILSVLDSNTGLNTSLGYLRSN